MSWDPRLRVWVPWRITSKGCETPSLPEVERGETVHQQWTNDHNWWHVHSDITSLHIILLCDLNQQKRNVIFLVFKSIVVSIQSIYTMRILLIGKLGRGFEIYLREGKGRRSKVIEIMIMTEASRRILSRFLWTAFSLLKVLPLVPLYPDWRLTVKCYHSSVV